MSIENTTPTPPPRREAAPPPKPQPAPAPAAPVSPARRDLIIAFVIAIVSITTALVAWRSSAVGSAAGDASRQQLIEAVKKTAANNNNWRTTYQEAAFAQIHLAYQAEAKVLEASDDATAKAQAAQLRQMLLPSLAKLSPFADAQYQNADGSFNLQKRFDELQAEAPDVTGLDPDASGKRAGLFYAEQRWLAVDVIVLAATLFWLTVAQITGSRLRAVTLVVGAVIYGLGLAGFAAVEIVFLIMRGSL